MRGQRTKVVTDGWGRSFNLLYTNGLFLQVWYNKPRRVAGVGGGGGGWGGGGQVLILKWYCILFTFYKQCGAWWNAALCCISSGSSLFAKYLLRGFPNTKDYFKGITFLSRVQCNQASGQDAFWNIQIFILFHPENIFLWCSLEASVVNTIKFSQQFKYVYFIISP